MTKVRKYASPLPLSNSRGFTLLEIIVVITIIALLTALVAPRFFGQVDKSRQVDAQAQIGLLGQALDLYRLEKGKYPSNEEGLTR
jgi:general secretion pathway protein G